MRRRDGHPSMLRAKKKKPMELIKLFAEACPAALALKNEDGATPLHLAVSGGANVATLRLLVETYPGALKDKTERGEVPLHLACRRDWPIERIKLLVESYPAALAQCNENGFAPLHVACQVRADAQVLRLLIEKCPAVLDFETAWTAWGQYSPKMIVEEEGGLWSPSCPDAVALFGALDKIYRCSSSDEDLFVILSDFLKIPWWGGAALLLDASPHIFHRLATIVDKAMPLILPKLGRDCCLNTLFEVIRNHPVLLANRVEEALVPKGVAPVTGPAKGPLEQTDFPCDCPGAPDPLPSLIALTDAKNYNKTRTTEPNTGREGPPTLAGTERWVENASAKAAKKEMNQAKNNKKCCAHQTCQQAKHRPNRFPSGKKSLWSSTARHRDNGSLDGAFQQKYAVPDEGCTVRKHDG